MNVRPGQQIAVSVSNMLWISRIPSLTLSVNTLTFDIVFASDFGNLYLRVSGTDVRGAKKFLQICWLE